MILTRWLAKHKEEVLISAVFWALTLFFLSPSFHDYGGDSAQYIIIGESIASGHGVRLVNYPGSPVSFYFPPVFPFLLAPLLYFFGRNFYLMHLLVSLFCYGGLLLFSRLIRPYTDRQTARSCVWFLVLNWAVIVYASNYILSDIPYFFFSLLALHAGFRYRGTATVLNRDGLLCLLWLAVSFLTRQAGIILAAGLCASFAFDGGRRGYRKALFVGGIIAALALGWHLAASLHQSPVPSRMEAFLLNDCYAYDAGGFLDSPGFFFRRLAGGAQRLFFVLPYSLFMLFVERQMVLGIIACCLVLFLVGAGILRQTRRERSEIFRYYFLFYIAALLFWPYSTFIEGVRYMTPVVAFGLFYCTIGLRRLLSHIRRVRDFSVFRLTVAVFLFFSAVNIVRLVGVYPLSFERQPAGLKNFVLMHRWADGHLEDTAGIVSRKPPVTYFLTRHQSVGYPYKTFDHRQFWEYLKAKGFRYIIVDEFAATTPAYLYPFIETYKERLALVHRIGNTFLFRIADEPA